MKKILAILLAMVMTFGLLTGCNKSLHSRRSRACLRRRRSL